ncbi:MAG: hypothetical protein ACYDHH_03795 [Solirubrobacteraceae bacterium]
MTRSNAANIGRAVAALAMALAACTALGGTYAAPARAASRPCALFLEPTSDRENIVWPEMTTTYEAGLVPIPPGGYAEIKGEFPHARFMSFQTSAENGKNINAWADFQIRPDAGSTNPFLPGADRTAAQRSYTIKVLDAPVPAAGPAANTLYNQSADGSVHGVPATALVVLRYYLPDQGTGRTAGVPAPTITLVTAAGLRIPTPTCQDPVGDPGYTQTLAALGPQSSVLPGTGPLVANRTPVWHKFVNAVGGEAEFLLENDVTGAAVYSQTPKYTSKLPAGFFENLYNKYTFANISSDLGQVVVFRGKLPSTPRTFNGEPTMGSGQLRFWSMCTGGTYSTVTYGCVVDKDVPVDANGNFTIAISTAAARPANAIAQCGVAWLPTGPPGQTLVIMRNMLPADSFAQAIQRVTPGQEQATMGAYYPSGRYYQTTAQFEKLGCNPPSAPVSGGSGTHTGSAHCATPTRLAFQLHAPRGERIVNAVGYVNVHRVASRRGHSLRTLTLDTPKRYPFTIRIVERTNTGARLTITRTYTGCSTTLKHAEQGKHRSQSTNRT